MPQNYLQSLHKKHNIPMSDLEKAWKDAKKNSKDETDYKLVTFIFKKIINKRFGLKESISFYDLINLYGYLNG